LAARQFCRSAAGDGQAVKAEVDKLGFLRGLGADRLDMSMLPAERSVVVHGRC
jgi:hypothetical protein